MTFIMKSKKFNGQTYRYHWDYPTRKAAQREANKLREKGWSARVFRWQGILTGGVPSTLHTVYKRKGD